MNKFFGVLALSFLVFSGLIPAASSAAAQGGGGSGGFIIATLTPIAIDSPQLVPRPAITYRLEMQKGWNLFSVPLNDAVLMGTNCVPKPYYHYDPAAHNYIIPGYLTSSAQFGAFLGYWFNAPQNCYAQFRGSQQLNVVSTELSQGWNQIGANWETINFNDMIGNCILTSGPYKFNTGSNNWVKTNVLQKGEGYFVNANSSCTLSLNSQPPFPPNETGMDLWTTGLGNTESNPNLDLKKGFETKFIVNILNFGSKTTPAAKLKIQGVSVTDAGPDGYYYVKPLAPGERAQIYFKYMMPYQDTVTITAIVDPLNEIAEANEGNNQIQLTFSTTGPQEKLADLTIIGGGITDRPLVGSLATLSVMIKNQGAAASPATYINVVGISLQEPQTSSGFYIPPLAPGETYTGTYHFTTPNQPVITVEVKVDPANLIAEQNENNNIITMYGYPSGTSQKGFDLAVVSLSMQPENPKVNEQMKISATIKNVGDTAGSIKGYGIAYSTGQYSIASSGKAYIASPIYLKPGETYVVDYWKTFDASGYWTAAFSVTGETEITYSNNDLAKTFYVYPLTPQRGFDLGVSDIQISNAFPVVGENVNIKAVVYNYGDVAGYLNSYSITFSGPGGGTGTGTSPNVYLTPGQSYVLSTSTSFSTAGAWTVAVTVNGALDINNANNQMSKSITVGSNQTVCKYYGDGRYQVWNIGCSVIANSGYEVKLEDISGFSPKRAQFAIYNGAYMVKRLYLLEGESTTVTQANNLKLEVYNVFPGAFGKQGLVDAAVTSNYYVTPTPSITPTPTVNPPLNRMFYDLVVYPQHAGSPASISLYDSSRVRGAQTNNDIIVTYEDMFDYDWNDLMFSTAYTTSGGVSRLKVKLLACDTAALDKTDIQLTLPGERVVELYSGSTLIETKTGTNMQFNLWTQCQGHAGEMRDIVIKYPATPSPTPSPSPSPMPPYTPQFYEINIKNNYWATPNLIQLYNPADRWRFQGSQSADGTSIFVNVEDSVDFDRDYNDLQFAVASKPDWTEVKVFSFSCETAANHEMTLAYKMYQQVKMTVLETGATAEGYFPEVQLWPSCHGADGQSRTVKIEPLASSPTPTPTISANMTETEAQTAL